MAANPVANGTLSRVHVVAGVLLAGAGFVLLLPPPVFFFLPKARFWTAELRRAAKGLNALGNSKYRTQDRCCEAATSSVRHWRTFYSNIT